MKRLFILLLVLASASTYHCVKSCDDVVEDCIAKCGANDSRCKALEAAAESLDCEVDENYEGKSDIICAGDAK